MRWSREKDYHGYRSYGGEGAGHRSPGGFLSRLAGALKAALQVVARPTPSAVTLSKDGRSGFSTLGSRGGHRRPAERPFPMASNDGARTGR
jgi:hypothetical protein